jgi:uncharacterized protein YaaN involved in tellurite resistance
LDINDNNIFRQSDISDLNKGEIKKIEKLSGSINIDDSQGVLEYGLGAQRKLADFANSVLSLMRSTKTGDIEYPLSELLSNVKSFDISDIKMKKSQSYGKFVKKARKVLLGYQKIDRQIYSIEVKLEEARNQLLRDIVLLGKMFDKNLEHKKILENYIYGAEKYLEALNTDEIDKEKANAEKQQDIKSASKISDLASRINRFEKRIHDLKLSRMVSIQMAPQIKLIHNTNQMLMEKIQTSLLATIPLWRNQMVIAVALMKQKSALKMQSEFVDKANRALEENSENLKQNTDYIEEKTKSGIEEIEKLKETSKNLISIIDECRQVLILGERQIETSKEELELISKDMDIKNIKK